MAIPKPNPIGEFLARHYHFVGGGLGDVEDFQSEILDILPHLPDNLRPIFEDALRDLDRRGAVEPTPEERHFLASTLFTGWVASRGLRVRSAEWREDEHAGRYRLFQIEINGDPYEFVALVGDDGRSDRSSIALELLTDGSRAAMAAARRAGIDLLQRLDAWEPPAAVAARKGPKLN